MIIEHSVHRGLAPAHGRPVDYIVVDKQEIMEELDGKSATVEPGSRFLGVTQIADDKEDGPDTLTFTQDEFPDMAKKYGGYAA
jgi:hypothetical protein